MLNEARQLIKLALPILIAQLSITAMSFVDTVMAGRYGRDDLAGIAIGGSFWLPVWLFALAIVQAVTPVVAQAIGRNDKHEASTALWQGLWLGFITGCFAAALLQLSLPLMEFMQVDISIRTISARYINYISWALPIVGMYQSMRSFIEGNGETAPIMAANFLGLCANIPLNYWFIYGGLGIEPMGGAGCGIATTLAFLVMTLSLALYITFGHLNTIACINPQRWPLWKEQYTLLRIGLPIAVATFAEVSIFAVLALLLAPLGADIVAGHQIALSVTMQIYMMPLSLSMALTIRAGHLVGGKHHDALKACLKSGMILSVMIAIVNACLILLGKDAIAALYTPNKEVQAIATGLLFFAAVYQIPDALQACSSGILRGFKITAMPMVILLLSYWLVALPLGYSLGLTDLLMPALGAKGLWIGLVAGLTVAAVFLPGLLYIIQKRYFNINTSS